MSPAGRSRLSLAGQVAAVIGAASGLGGAGAFDLARRGTRVLAVERVRSRPAVAAIRARTPPGKARRTDLRALYADTCKGRGLIPGSRPQ